MKLHCFSQYVICSLLSLYANAFARLIQTMQTCVLPKSPQLGGGRSIGQFPTKQTQNLHLAVIKNRQIWEKLSNYFSFTFCGMKICKCDKPRCSIRQYALVSSIPQYENDYAIVTEVKFLVNRLCVKQLIVVKIYTNTHVHVNVTIHMLT